MFPLYLCQFASLIFFFFFSSGALSSWRRSSTTRSTPSAPSLDCIYLTFVRFCSSSDSSCFPRSVESLSISHPLSTFETLAENSKKKKKKRGRKRERAKYIYIYNHWRNGETALVYSARLLVWVGTKREREKNNGGCNLMVDTYPSSLLLCLCLFTPSSSSSFCAWNPPPYPACNKCFCTWRLPSFLFFLLPLHSRVCGH